MKHGIAFRKLSRDTSHRMMMLRNLVTSLLQYETVKTTLPKAQETARMAEKIITLGKNRDQHAWRKVTGFVLDPSVLPKLFGTFANRYANRPGGYTRIHKFGNRLGDNAPMAVLELVDNPRDIKMEVTARAVGMEMLKARLQTGSIPDIMQNGLKGADEFILKEVNMSADKVGELRSATRFNLQKILKYGRPTIVAEMAHKAEEHIVRPFPAHSLRCFTDLSSGRATR
ncbi:ribosomal protein L17 [Athelia psychrophila]|uniref:Ribosomal protein L17 n=1 Tax=Athelia psychrophila TaxID=1759441 RepID=A0A166U2Y1_9AGAM|nr:ribosomal protein L17 [Fibularhizoctonia sp. CBS 109695]